MDDGVTGEYRYNALGQRIYKKGVAIACDVNGDGTVDQNDLHAVNGKDGAVIEADGPGKGEAKGKGQSAACVATKNGAYANHGLGVENKAPGGSREALFNYDGHRLLGEYDPQGNAIQETVWLGNLPVATFQNGNVYDIHTDHLGTPRVITDSNNTEVWRWDSDPFGMAAANEDPDGDGQVVTYHLRFPGQYYDGETGKHYNYFRDYDPGTGRYIESDPIGVTRDYSSPEIQALVEFGLIEETGNAGEPINHLYGYVGQKPNVWFDPFGLAKKKYEKPKNPNKKETDRSGSGRKKADGGRQRNIGHEDGEEHNRSNRGKSGGAIMRGFNPYLFSIHLACSEGEAPCDICKLLGFYNPVCNGEGCDI